MWLLFLDPKTVATLVYNICALNAPTPSPMAHIISPHTTVWKLLNYDVPTPAPPPPPPYDIQTVYCSETPKSNAPTHTPYIPIHHCLETPQSQYYNPPTPTSYPHVTAQL